jgi:uncharacterized membrane protein
MKPSPTTLERRIENTIGNLLRLGVLLSATLVAAGAALYLWRHGQTPAAYRVFRNDSPELCALGGILHAAFAFQGRGLIQLGLLVLIATPVTRVAFSIWGFAVLRDRTYVLVATLVLATLLYSLFVSAPGL